GDARDQRGHGGGRVERVVRDGARVGDLQQVAAAGGGERREGQGEGPQLDRRRHGSSPPRTRSWRGASPGTTGTRAARSSRAGRGWCGSRPSPERSRNSRWWSTGRGRRGAATRSWRRG